MPVVQLGTIDTTMPSADFVLNALLNHQYFPTVKERNPLFPPFFSSATFSEDIARDLETKNPVVPKANTPGTTTVYETPYVMFRARKHDGNIRRLGLPHPVPYSALALHIHQHWSHIHRALRSDLSVIKPLPHDDGRIVLMDYEPASIRAARDTQAAQGMRYRVHADISSCFPSIYTHSLDWALRGIDEAKKSRSATAHWEARLDQLVRNCHYGETTGLMIGPAVSNLLSELVLQQVDTALFPYQFVRYIDDYTAYFSSREDAESFVVQLDQQLGHYRLWLNARKTQIVSLQDSDDPDAWINEVSASLPSRIAPVNVSRYLRHCEALARRYRDKSVLLFAVKPLLSSLRRALDGSDATAAEKAVAPLVDELVRINQFHPHLSCAVVSVIEEFNAKFTDEDRARWATQFRFQLEECAKRHETDAALWLLYGITQVMGQPLGARAHLLDMNDDLAWVALATVGESELSEVVAKVRSAHDWTIGPVCQEHWLIRYELYRVGELDDTELNKYYELDWFQLARSRGLRFSILEERTTS